MLFMKMRRSGTFPRSRLSLTSFLDKSSPKRGGFEQEPEVGTSLVDTAAPIAGSINEYQAAKPGVDAYEGATRPNDLVTYSNPVQHPLASLVGGKQRSQKRLNDQPRALFANSALSLQNDATSQAQSLPNSMAQATQIDLVQQSQPANSSRCPFQIQKRLQDKQRPHNSTDPRPCARASKHLNGDRESVSTMSSHPSSRFPSRFSFGLLFSPSLDLFKFKDIRTSLGGRGSGWSDWFKKEDSPTEKASGL